MRKKAGRKPLGKHKREHTVNLRFNDTEMKTIKILLESYNLDFKKRGVLGPFLRRLILQDKAVLETRISDSTSNLTYQINKIGTNINQLVKVANYKNLIRPNSKLELEMQKSNELMRKIFGLLDDKRE
ncbi:plasmid mobilization relaxosome protein MobC [Ulvibacterium marinum]|uniref:Plasmid mobilization relaxosome protein MobC n=1 Tax=Ulvibacterium marinum TaxID=2419782 RepID=A0A3B0CF28_9FLAO|nr:plasmid mobilization relaxosome protein MobC [Ulvibacterium marinum]RKN83478.1 plasmid mobilization relaxosome protein MobC [Ulvibacterium marinum]